MLQICIAAKLFGFIAELLNSTVEFSCGKNKNNLKNVSIIESIKTTQTKVQLFVQHFSAKWKSNCFEIFNIKVDIDLSSKFKSLCKKVDCVE